jgi:hypothetical protein
MLDQLLPEEEVASGLQRRILAGIGESGRNLVREPEGRRFLQTLTQDIIVRLLANAFSVKLRNSRKDGVFRIGGVQG